MTYAIVTAAKNEAALLRRTIESVIAQNHLPSRWVIVDDGSTDPTGEIAESYASRFGWIRLVHRHSTLRRSFGAKATAFSLGCDYLVDVDYECVGNLDADIEIGPEYYARVLERFEQDPRLGIAGGAFLEIGRDGRWHRVRSSPDSVRGAVQLFRRNCYEEVGGYLPLRRGGIDAAAEITARSFGWHVRTFPEIVVRHLRPTGHLVGGGIQRSVRKGIKDRSLGYGVAFETVRCLSRARERPLLLAAMARLIGYGCAWVRGDRSVLSSEVVRRFRFEQREKLAKVLSMRGSLQPFCRTDLQSTSRANIKESAPFARASHSKLTETAEGRPPFVEGLEPPR